MRRFTMPKGLVIALGFQLESSKGNKKSPDHSENNDFKMFWEGWEENDIL